MTRYQNPVTPLNCAAEEADRARAALRSRDDWIREAHGAGHSLRVIARAVGLSHAGVKKITER